MALNPAIQDILASSPGLLQKALDDMVKAAERDRTIQEQNSSSAFRDLQSAQAAPPAQPGAMEGGVSQLFGDVASTISRDPKFAQRAKDEIMAKRALLIQQRTENLSVLHDRYLEMAAQVGKLDPVKEMQYRQKADTLAKQLEQQHETNLHGADNLAAMNRTEASNRSEERRTQMVVQAQRDVAQKNYEARTQVADAVADARVQAAEAKGAGVFDTKARLKALDALYNRSIKNKEKRIPKEVVPIYINGVLSMPPANDQNVNAWSKEIKGHILAATGKKDLTDAQLAEIKLWRALHFSAAPMDSTDMNTPAQ